MVGDRQVVFIGVGVMMFEVMTAVVKKVAVAMRERGDRRERPDTI